MKTGKLFDDWPERYDKWFQTPIGKQVIKYERAIVRELFRPAPAEKILDAGCGTGLFTLDFLNAGAHVVGLELSYPMLLMAYRRTSSYSFEGIQGDMTALPFEDACFDKVISVTALEFIADAQGTVGELFRVTRPGGRILVATLNSLSPWAARRQAKTEKGQKHILEKAFFRSPEEIRALAPYQGRTKTAVFFNKDDDPGRVAEIEHDGQAAGLDTGAFVATCWQKP